MKIQIMCANRENLDERHMLNLWKDYVINEFIACGYLKIANGSSFMY